MLSFIGRYLYFTVADSCSVVSNQQAKQSSLNKDGKVLSAGLDIKTAGRNRNPFRGTAIQSESSPSRHKYDAGLVSTEGPRHSLMRFSVMKHFRASARSASVHLQHFSYVSPDNNKMSYCLDHQILCGDAVSEEGVALSLCSIVPTPSSRFITNCSVNTQTEAAGSPS